MMMDTILVNQILYIIKYNSVFLITGYLRMRLICEKSLHVSLKCRDGLCISLICL